MGCKMFCGGVMCGNGDRRVIEMKLGSVFLKLKNGAKATHENTTRIAGNESNDEE